MVAAHLIILSQADWAERVDTYNRMAVSVRKENKISHAFQNMLIADYPPWDSPLFGGGVPSEETLIKIFKTEMGDREPIMSSWMMQYTGRIIKCDHTHKSAKIVKVNGEKPCEALFSVMNEFNEIMGFYITGGKSMSELEEALKAMRKRYEHLPEVCQIKGCFTDKCCADRALLRAIFGSILVKLDMFHLLNRPRLKKSHRLFKSFMKKFREIFLCESTEDLDFVKDVLIARENPEDIEISNKYLTNNKYRRRYITDVN